MLNSREHLAPTDRAEGVAMALDTLAGLVGQADDLDVVGRDGLGILLELLAQELLRAIGGVRTAA